MQTRRMNERITVYTKSGGQNEDGEVIDSIRTDLFSCWTEVKKTTVRDFKTVSSSDSDVDGISKTKDNKVFLIRYVPELPLDNSMFVDFHGEEYKIDRVEVDFASKDMIMISAVMVV